MRHDHHRGQRAGELARFPSPDELRRRELEAIRKVNERLEELHPVVAP